MKNLIRFAILALAGCGVARADYNPVAPYSVLGNSTASTVAPPAQLQNIVLGAPGFAETGSAASSQITTTSALQGNTFVEFEIQGLNSGTGASTDFVATADNGTGSAHFVDMGINSSGNNSGTYPTGANLAFLESQTDALYVGTVGATTLHFFTNSSDVMTLASGGAVTFPGQTTAGIHTNNASGVLASLSNASSVNSTLMGILGTGWSSSSTLYLAANGTWGTPAGSVSLSANNAFTGTNSFLSTASVALPSGAQTAGSNVSYTAGTLTVSTANTATTWSAIYHGVTTFTDASAGAGTDIFNENWAGPAAVAGSFTTTRAHTLGILDSTSAASSVTGGLVVATTYGTAATSVGIGGGNINAGGSITGASLTSAGNITSGSGSTIGSSASGVTLNGVNAVNLTINASLKAGINSNGLFQAGQGNDATTAWGFGGLLFSVSGGGTLTENGTAGTRTNTVMSVFGQPTLTSTNAITYTNLSNLYVNGAVISGANSAPAADIGLWIGAGSSTAGAGTAPTSTYGLRVDNSTGGTSHNYAAIFGTNGTAVTNIRHGITSALSGGTATVTDAGATANTRYFFTTHTLGTVSVAGAYYASARSAGVNFTITSNFATDTSTVDWMAIEP